MDMLTERDLELHKLQRALVQVTDNGGRVMLVHGEAGIGKTSLVREFLKTLPGDVRAVQGMCDPLSTPRPLGPVSEIVSGILGPQTDYETSFTATFIDTLGGADCRYVLVLEDMQWADQASLDWLKYFCRRIALVPVLLIVTFRDNEVDADHPLRSALGVIPGDRTQRLHLAPLSVDGVAAFDLPPSMSAGHLHEITGGNPFFITEILGNPDESQNVPESIRDAVNARLNQLPETVRQVLEVAACFPAEIQPAVLEQVLARPVEADLAVAERLQLIIATAGGYRFRHELARRATQMRLPDREKQRIHGQLLDALLAHNDLDPFLAEIVHHAEGANDNEALLRFAPMAAKYAARMGAHREAAHLLSISMAHADMAEPHVAAEICEMWAYEAGLSLTIDEEVIAARKRAVALWRELGQSERVGENLRWLSRLHWYRGEPDKAKTYLEEAIEILQREPSVATAMAFSLRSQFHMLQDEMEEAQAWGLKALKIAETFDALEVRAHALNTIGTAKLFRGDLDGEAFLRESLSLSLQHGYHEQAARVYTNLSECLIELGQLGKAEPLIDEGITFDVSHDLDAWTYYLVGRRAQLRFEQDRYLEAIDIARGVLSRENQTVLMQLPAKIILARALLRIGDPDSRCALDDALADAKKINELQYLAVVWIAFVEAAVLWREPGLAAEYLPKLKELETNALSPRKWAEYRFWARRIDPNAISHTPSRSIEGFALDFDGQPEAAASWFQRSGAVFFAATCLCDSRNSADLSTADQLYASIGSLAGRNYLRQRMHNGSQSLPKLTRGRYKIARRHPYGLTKKEQAVLLQIINGSSNGDIARNLSRSKRTIENHVSSIFSKIGTRDRVELILKAQEEPWLTEKTIP